MRPRATRGPAASDRRQAGAERAALRAWLAGVDDLRIPPPPDELKRHTESLDWAEAGIAVMLGGSALIAMVLALVVTFQHSVG